MRTFTASFLDHYIVTSICFYKWFSSTNQLRSKFKAKATDLKFGMNHPLIGVPNYDQAD